MTHNTTDRVVSVPMFNLLCIQQRLKIARSPAGTIAELMDELANITDLVNEAIVHLHQDEQARTGGEPHV